MSFRLTVTVMLLLTLLVGCGKQPKKKYEQAIVPPGAPKFTIRVIRNGPRFDLPLLKETINQFARSNAFRECEVPQYSIYHGPGYPDPLYKSDQFMIWSWSPAPKEVFYFAPHTTNYSSQEFDRLTNALVMTVSAAFPGQVEVKILTKPPRP